MVNNNKLGIPIVYLLEQASRRQNPSHLVWIEKYFFESILTAEKSFCVLLE